MSSSQAATPAKVAPPTIRIVPTSAVSPNPAAVNQYAAAGFTIEFDDPSTGQELPPPSGTTYSWSITAVYNGQTAVTNPNVTISPSTAQSVSVTSFFGTPGVYLIGIQCNVYNSSWTTSPVNAATAYNLTVQDITVTMSPIKTGFTQTVGTLAPNKAITTTVVATVVPASQANNVTFTTGSTTARIPTVSNAVYNSSAGTITFTITGLSATPASAPNGDTTLFAQVNGVTKGQAQVVVVVPASLVQPSGTTTQSVAGVNHVESATSVPSYAGLPANTVALLTGYDQNLTLQVDDQFGKPLDQLYAGVAISESGGTPINVFLSGNGTYTDVVGESVPKNPSRYTSQQNGGYNSGYTVPAGSVPANNWTSLALMPFLPDAPHLQQFSVEVGGQSLSPAVNRTITASAPNTISVQSNN